jgi:transglutaminase-like putative cysteine protease
MSWRIRVIHATEYSYAAPVSPSYNEARLTPRGDGGRVVVDSRVDVIPAVRVSAYRDYWGNTVSVFDVQQPHTTLRITGTSVVETEAAPAQVPDAGWATLGSTEVLDKYAELLAPSLLTAADTRLSKHARGLRAKATPVDAVHAAATWTRETLTYRRGVTGTHSTAADAVTAGIGVCQDFAHVTIAMLRSIGIPARYCSGYLLPSADIAVGATVDGESHAWVDVWTGGWWGWDPTNDIPIGEQHVPVAHGRDYSDVPPLKGVYSGASTQNLDVAVRMTRLD